MMRVRITDVHLRPDRQRKDLGDLSSLKASLSNPAIGQLNPITVEPREEGGFWLLAGERRLTAMRELLYEEIAATLREDLDATSRELLELDENVKRKQLTWQEEAIAIVRYAKLRRDQEVARGNNSLTARAIADELGEHPMMITRALTVGPRIIEGAPKYSEKLAKADSLSAAYNFVARQEDRRKAEIHSQILHDTSKGLLNEQEEEPREPSAGSGDAGGPVRNGPADVGGAESGTGVAAVQPAPSKAREKVQVSQPEPVVITADFRHWAAGYTGPKFSFLHCDLPYGIEYEGAKNAGVEGGNYAEYKDDEELYWSLLGSLMENLPRLCYPMAHMLFWFDMRHYGRTISYIESKSDFRLVTPNPIIWHKTDNVGQMSDHKRRPRHIYECALLFSRGDRQVITPISDVVPAPTNRSSRDHKSEKPEPVLRKLLAAYVDDTTSVLDPTCGSGSALVVANELGAKHVVGVEFEQEIADIAKARIRRALALKLAGEAA